mmetsp:Transcript_1/g.12  ORF Transcript_1/g.12 Transcript_1/m.12 type:complete len:106 (-) Transcript_1:189-506(-)
MPGSIRLQGAIRPRRRIGRWPVQTATTKAVDLIRLRDGAAGARPDSFEPSLLTLAIDDRLFVRRPVMHNRPYPDGGRREAQSTGDFAPKRSRRRVKDASKGSSVD